ncbi:mast cell protease 4-like [Chanos chanos]|uniref:trypsin n=1 Tax=Chanos chanos TaxID=29144 RepID=A0A6J2W920_CHACN|nr:mast cell protease 4-like [Chanos chanos]
MVSVQKDNEHYCGGFLVSHFFVMTAAHCWEKGMELTVVLGAHDLSIKETFSYRLSVKLYHVYPGFNKTTLKNDIMLLQLPQKAQKSKTVDTIPFARKDKKVKAGAKCDVAGWGSKKRNGPRAPKLHEADVKVASKKKCQAYRSYDPSVMLCIGGKAGFCKGDSGGPLVCEKEAVGLVSFNEKGNCDKPTIPNVYTKISAFVPWVEAVIKSVK